MSISNGTTWPEQSLTAEDARALRAEEWERVNHHPRHSFHNANAQRDRAEREQRAQRAATVQLVCIAITWSALALGVVGVGWLCIVGAWAILGGI